MVRWLFSNLRREGRTLACIRVDEDGALKLSLRHFADTFAMKKTLF
jgi:hypothetical protein